MGGVRVRAAFFILCLLYFVVYQPVGGVIDHRKFLRGLNEGGTRLKYYSLLIVEITVPSAIVLLLIFSGWYSAADVGLKLPGWSGVINRWVAYGVLAVTGVYALLILQQLVMARVSQSYRDKLAAVKLPDDILQMMPRTPAEKRLWGWVSLTAGLFEEFLYRGFLLFILKTLFPEINITLAIAVLGVVFGLGHCYQGWLGVLRTGLYGMMLAALYVVTGSILPGIVLHFLSDFAAKDLEGGRLSESAGA